MSQHSLLLNGSQCSVALSFTWDYHRYAIASRTLSYLLSGIPTMSLRCVIAQLLHGVYVICIDNTFFIQ